MSRAPGIDVTRVKSLILDSLGVPADAPWYAAYSGGIDSTVLLHLLSRICRDEGIHLVALHADHGLHPRSGDWRRRCRDQCRAWGIDYHDTRLDLAGDRKLGPEGRARAARYRWFREAAGAGAWLFTAHHRRDQAETVIERLTRGAGPNGLRGIRPLTRLHDLRVVRPLLAVGRGAIERYAADQGLDWVTDDSNRDARYTRNYIRSRVLPVLAGRWPDIETALGRTARVMADAQQVLDERADDDLARLDDRPLRGDPSLAVPALRALAPARRRNALRRWIQREAGVNLGFDRLDRVAGAIARYPRDSGGLRWPPVDLRLFHDRLYLVRDWQPPAGPLDWDAAGELRIGDRIILRAHKSTGRGLKPEALAGGVQIAFRRGGEKCRLPGRRHRHTLKNLLQEAGVPPWQRPRMPLILVDGAIAAVPGLTACEPWAAAPGEAGVEIEAAYV